MNFQQINKALLKYCIPAMMILLMFAGRLQGQENNDCNKKRLTGLVITESIGYTGTMTGLYSLWYSGYPMEQFHFFNDIHGWQGIDKFGHNLSAYYVGRLGYDVMKWACNNEKKAIWYGGTLGFVFLTSVEIFDGFSSGWGASPYDILANTFGAASFIGQQLAFGEQYATFKFSYHHSPYQVYNPDALGHHFPERLLKDYNGQTHWLSLNLKPLTGLEFVPAWLNIALGYSANGMINGYDNPTVINGKPIPYFKPYSQFFLSFDADLTKIETSSKFLNILFETIGFIKIPFPAIEYNTQDNWQFHLLYI